MDVKKQQRLGEVVNSTRHLGTEDSILEEIDSRFGTGTGRFLGVSSGHSDRQIDDHLMVI